MNHVELGPTSLGLLREIRDRLPAPTGVVTHDAVAAFSALGSDGPNPFLHEPVAVRMVNVPMRDEKPARPAEKAAVRPVGDTLALGHRQALASLLGILDGWIEGAHENHEALGHRGEDTPWALGHRGEDTPCWKQFTPADIRAMVNDAARHLAVPEFPAPANPRENGPW